MSEEARGWQPIETAPRTLGEFVAVWAVYRLIVNGEVHTEQAERYALARWVDWSTGVGRWIDAGGNDIEYSATEKDDEDTIVCERRVTHWMPLPAPPNSEQDGSTPKSSLRDQIRVARDEFEFLRKHLGDLAHYLQVIHPNEEAVTEAYHKARYAKERTEVALSLLPKEGEK